MLKKRLAGVITVKDGLAVQSFGYRRYLPLGLPEVLAENLDRWGADEIIVLSIDRSSRGLGPDLALVKRIGGLGLSTPLTYGGGVSKVPEAAAVIESGAERLCLDAVLWRNQEEVRAMAQLVGAQALLAVLPLSWDGSAMQRLDHVTGGSAPFASGGFPLFDDGVISEAMIIDWRHEGFRNAFDMNLVEHFPFDKIPLIPFGGLSEASQLASLLVLPRIVAAGVGNFLSYSEHAVQALKEQLTGLPLRPAAYAAAF
jgi:cyclase